jgi:hypothetical protein
MVSFAKALQPGDVEAIRAYLVSAAIELQQTSPNPGDPFVPAVARGHAD